METENQFNDIEIKRTPFGGCALADLFAEQKKKSKCCKKHKTSKRCKSCPKG